MNYNQDTLTREAMAKRIQANLFVDLHDAQKSVEVILGCMLDTLNKKKNLKIRSFGTFKVYEKKERIGRNPKTKITVMIPKRFVIRFKASALLKKKIQGCFLNF